MVAVVGETECVPEATGVTAPMPWSIENAVAFVVTQEITDAEPVSMEAGVAVSAHVGAGGGADVTVSVAAQVVEPPAPVTVAV